MHFNSFGEEQQYNSGDAVNRSTTGMGDSGPTTTGDLDEHESTLMSNEFFDETEE